ncbi:ester cyclase [Magnetospirillum sp. 15-1]|uniref:nuclear transport factor 2 family protein n=1 Tax=Magnetospirillum sp. 15-1 TaxID=1979370 RepID=UPI000BBB83C3|nr:ester cyclase [Magnetospirillum sp. 15-1]
MPELTHDQKRDLVLNFYREVVLGQKFELASKYMSPNYKQHTPACGDGVDGLLEFCRKLFTALPEFKIEFKRVFVSDNYVVIHSHAVLAPGSRGEAVVDIFRLEGDKVAEHWDVVQSIPETALNNNGMF